MPTTELRTVWDLNPSDHLCCIYETEAEHRALLTNFLRDGLERNDLVLYIADAHTAETVIGYLQDDGIAVADYLARGQFKLLTVTDTYLQDGVFDPDKMIALLERETAHALALGYAALRVTGEMTWVLRGAPGSERLIEYEAKLNYFFPTHPCLALCQYDRRQFSANVLLDVLRTHPIAALGTELCDNPYFLPPEEMLGNDIANNTLRHWVSAILARKQAHLTLEQQVARRTSELAASQAITHALLDATGDSAILVDTDGIVYAANAIAAARFGKTPAEMLGICVYDLLPAENARLRKQHALEALATGTTVTFEDQIGERWFEQHIQPIRQADLPPDRVAVFVRDITEPKRIQAALRESEEKYRTLFENMAQGAFYQRADGVLTDVNQASLDMLGLTRDQYLGKTSYDPSWKVIREDGSDLPTEQHGSMVALRTGQPVKDMVIGVYNPRHHTYTWLQVNATPQFKPNEDKPYQVFVTMHNITKRKRTEDALRESEEEYRRIVETTNEGIWIINVQALTTFVNPQMAEMLGYTVNEMLGQSLFAFMDEQGKQDAQRKFERRQQGIKEQHDFRFRRKDGTDLWAMLSTNPIMKDGTFIGALAMVTDITERKRDEDHVRSVSAYNRSLIEAALDPLVTINPDGKISDVNLATEKAVGRARAEIIGTDFSDYFTEPDLARDGFRRAFTDGAVRDYELAIRRVDGTIIPVLYNATIYRDESGQVMGVFAAARDITERKQAEVTLRQANLELDRRSRELEIRNLQVTLLNEMGDLLQTCRTIEETYPIVPQFAQQLFPEQTGALYVYTASKNLVEAVSLWGDLPSDDQVFGFEECWALRRNRANIAYGNGATLVCPHIVQPTVISVCVPLIAQNETIGLLHLRTAATQTAAWSDDQTSLAITLADRLALALSNLKLQELLREQAMHDVLTGLFNRRYMEEMLEREIRRANRSQQPVSVMLIDLDHLKQINDRWGHNAGDLALRQVGDLLTSHVRGADIACRQGGDEFTLILHETTLAHALERAEQLRQAAAELPLTFEGETTYSINLSIGIAASPTHGTNVEAVLRAADAALYRAKSQGRNRVIVAE